MAAFEKGGQVLWDSRDVARIGPDFLGKILSSGVSAICHDEIRGAWGLVAAV